MIMQRQPDGTYEQIGFIESKDGEEIGTIVDASGDVYFTRGLDLEASGEPPLVVNAIGKDLKGYQIYGNSIQDGTPTPNNPIEIQSVGDKTANLFNENDVTYGYWITDTGNVSNVVISARYNRDIAVITGKTICVRAYGERPFNIAIGYYDADNAFVLRVTSMNGSLVSTPPANAAYGVVYVANGSSASTVPITPEKLASYKIMLTYGDSIAYEPYGYKIPVVTSGENHEPITTNIYLDEPLRKIGSYADVIDFERGVVERKIGKVVFDGSDDEQWYYYAQPGVSQKYITVDIVGGSPVISDKLRSISNQQRPYQYDSIYSASNPPSISINSEIPNSSDEWRNWLSENHITAYYVLAESTTEPISIPSIPTFDSTTVIRVDTEIQPSNMYVKYKGKKK